MGEGLLEPLNPRCRTLVRSLQILSIQNVVGMALQTINPLLV